MSKPIDFPTSIYTAKAVWMGVGSQNNLLKKGKWHKWVSEIFVFFRIHFN